MTLKKTRKEEVNELCTRLIFLRSLEKCYKKRGKKKAKRLRQAQKEIRSCELTLKTLGYNGDVSYG